MLKNLSLSPWEKEFKLKRIKNLDNIYNQK